MRTLPDTRLAVPRRALTFLLVLLGWVLFRSLDLGQAGRLLRRDGGARTSAGWTRRCGCAATPEAITALVVGALSVLLPRDLVMGRVGRGGLGGPAAAARIAVVALAPLAAIAVAAGSFSPFLYFQF